MTTKAKYIVVLFAGRVLSLPGTSASVCGQEQAEWQNITAASSSIDFEYIRYHSPWLSGRNMSELVYELPVDRISKAQMSYDNNSGGFVNYYRSDRQYRYGAHTESFIKLSPNVGLYGKIGYSNRTDKRVGGSAFIDPYFNPLDFVEAADTNQGRKRLETYDLIGGVSFAISQKIGAGIRVDYTSANYSKDKDLRHKNKFMDLTLSPGISYRVLPSLTIGANYTYRRTNESIMFKSYGNADKSYTSIVSVGGFFGYAETMSAGSRQDGYLASSSGFVERPLFNEFHGGGFLFDAQITGRLSLFGEAEIYTRDGYFGKKSQSSVEFTAHESDIFRYRVALRLAGSKSRHMLSGELGRERLTNKENSYKEIKPPGEVPYYEYYGSNTVLKRDYMTGRVEYRGDFNMQGAYPIYTAGASFDYFERDQTASLYPFFRRQEVSHYDIRLSLTRNIFHRRNIYGITLAGLYGTGGSGMENDGLYATPAATQRQPGSMDLYMERELEYLTSVRFGGEVKLNFSRSYFVPQPIRVYLEAGLRYTKADTAVFLTGSDFREITLSAGCLF